MKNHSYISMQQDMPDQGQLQVTVLDSASNRPVENATVRISYTGVPDNVIEEIRTDSSGKTPMLELVAPPLEYSMKPVEQQPYAEYTVRISAEGFTPKEVAGTEVLPHSIARQGASLFPPPRSRYHSRRASRVVERTISGSSSDPIRFLGNILLKIRKQRSSR